VVEEGSLTVVNVSHDSDHRWTREEILLCILCLSLSDCICKVRCDEFNFIAEFFSNKHESLCVETLVDRHHHSEAHTSSDDLCHRSVVHQRSKVVYSHELGHLEHLLLELLHLHLLLHPL
jgi:hypothetical protein